MAVDRHNSLSLPNFLLIGVSKAGTSWIFEILREHPDVFVPVAKDIYFFDRYFEKGLQWYARFFKDARNEKAVGELSHDYCLSAETARRIHETLPAVKLICCLREIGDKLVSEYTYNLSTNVGRQLTFEEYVELPEITRLLDYYGHLRPFYELFPRENILILFYDDLKAAPAQFARSLYEFLGVDPAFRPPSLEARVNVAHQARLELAAHFVYRVAQLLRWVGLANLVGAVKRNRYFERLLYKPQSKRFQAPEEILERVRTQYRENYDRLASLIGKSLPRDWY